MSDESLGHAAYIGDLARVRRLLDAGPDEVWGTGTPLLQVLDEPADCFTDTELLIAEALLDAGASLDAAGADGRTPMHVAVRPGPRALQLLRDRGADLDVQNAHTGDTPLHCAVEETKVASVEWLLANGADPTRRNHAGLTPVDCARHAADSEPDEDLMRIIALLTP
jgi:ankyrin repeat protein